MSGTCRCRLAGVRCHGSTSWMSTDNCYCLAGSRRLDEARELPRGQPFERLAKHSWLFRRPSQCSLPASRAQVYRAASLKGPGHAQILGPDTPSQPELPPHLTSVEIEHTLIAALRPPAALARVVWAGRGALLSLREANIGLPTYALDAAGLTCLQTDTAPRKHTIREPAALFPAKKRATLCGLQGRREAVLGQGSTLLLPVDDAEHHLQVLSDAPANDEPTVNALHAGRPAYRSPAVRRQQPRPGEGEVRGLCQETPQGTAHPAATHPPPR